MIRVNAHFFENNTISLFDFCTYLIKGLLAVRTTENGLTIFYWGYEVIMDLIRVMFSGPDRSHTLTLPYKVTAQQAARN